MPDFPADLTDEAGMRAAGRVDRDDRPGDFVLARCTVVDPAVDRSNHLIVRQATAPAYGGRRMIIEETTLRPARLANSALPAINHDAG